MTARCVEPVSWSFRSFSLPSLQPRPMNGARRRPRRPSAPKPDSNRIRTVLNIPPFFLFPSCMGSVLPMANRFRTGFKSVWNRFGSVFHGYYGLEPVYGRNCFRYETGFWTDSNRFASRFDWMGKAVKGARSVVVAYDVWWTRESASGAVACNGTRQIPLCPLCCCCCFFPFIIFAYAANYF